MKKNKIPAYTELSFDNLKKKDKISKSINTPHSRGTRQISEPKQITFSDMQNSNAEKISHSASNTAETNTPDIINLLKTNGIKYVDNREIGGNLWIVGGPELLDTVRKAGTLGYSFRYKKEGSRATKKQPGWWMK